MSDAFHALYVDYQHRFGNTFSWFAVGPAEESHVMTEMTKALQGKRGPITDEEAGLAEILRPDEDF